MMIRKRLPVNTGIARRFARNICPKKCLSWVLLFIFCFGLAGCGNQPIAPETDEFVPAPPVAAVDTTDPVHQVWLVPGDAPTDLAKVYETVNTQLKEEINTTIELKFIPWQMWAGQTETLLSADTAPEALYVSSSANYDRLAEKGLLQEINMDMLTQSAPKIAQALADYTPDGLKECNIGGKAFMVPSVGNLWVDDYPVLIRGDICAKLGLNEITTLDALDEYLKMAAKAELGTWGADMESLSAYLKLAWFQPNNMLPVVEDFPFLAYNITDETAKIVNAMEDKNFSDSLLRLRSLAIAGALPETVLYSRMPAVRQWQMGQSACLVSNMETISENYDLAFRDHPEWKTEICFLNPDAKRVKQAVNRQGLALNVSNDKPERTLLVLDMLYGTKSLQDLTLAGIAGTHRLDGQSGYYEPGPEAARFSFNNTGVWAWKNRDLAMAGSSQGWILKDLYDKWNADESKVVHAPLGAFVFDMAPIASQLQALQTTLTTVGQFLLAGASDDLPTDMKKLQDAFTAAGIDDARIEMQRQVDDFLKK